MKYTETALPGVWLIEPAVYPDARGYFMESYRKETFDRHVGPVDFVQDNESCSSQGTLRGLHYQLEPYTQAKLVRVIEGAVLDVGVDLRRGSPTFGQYIAVELTADNKRQLYLPRGFAHGFFVISPRAIFTYKVDRPYAPQADRGIRFDDPAIGIDWRIPAAMAVLTSDKDARQPLLRDAEINFDYRS